jgi:RHS repeat-associated protein
MQNINQQSHRLKVLKNIISNVLVAGFYVFLLLAFIFLPQILLAQSEQRKFGGHEFDFDTGLLYVDSRYYSPSNAKFLSPDPVVMDFDLSTSYGQAMLHDPQLQNRYSYGRNNPMRFIDPTGEMVEEFQPYVKTSGLFGEGEVFGEYRGVSMYSGGVLATTPDAVTEAQCVTFVKSFAKSQFGVSLGGAGDAWAYSDPANLNRRIAIQSPEVGGEFVKYGNGGSVLPQENDIISWTGGSLGHVGIVAETVFDEASGTGMVYTVEQNTSRDKAIFASTITRGVNSNGEIMYTMSGKGQSLQVSGWLRYSKNGTQESIAPTKVNHTPNTKKSKKVN